MAVTSDNPGHPNTPTLQHSITPLLQHFRLADEDDFDDERNCFTKKGEQVLYASVPVMADTPDTKNPNTVVDLPPPRLGRGTGSAKPPKPTYVVDADKPLSSHPLELWAYRELFLLLVKRDFVAVYKQTVLGPLRLFVQRFWLTWYL
jgi:hypothetical protein